MTAHQVGFVVMAAICVGCAVLLTRVGIRLTAVLLAAGAVTFALGVVDRWADGASLTAQLVAGLVLMPVAVLAYPRFGAVSRMVDGATVAVLLAVGLVAILAPGGAAVVPASVASIGVIVVHLWWRFERQPPSARRPLVWLLVGLVVPMIALFVTSFVIPSTPALEAIALASLGVPAVSMVLGVRRPDIVDARGIIVEATVVGAASAACVALYVTIVSSLTLLLGVRPEVGVQGIVACCCAFAVHPLRRVLHDTVDELLFGRRPDPLAAVAQVAAGELRDPHEATTRIRNALVLPYAEIRIAGTTLAVSGEVTPYVRRFSLGHEMDELVVGLRPGDLQLAAVDTEVLALIARLLGQTRRAEALAAELSLSRAAIRGAVEDERRRLRRELHDGLGPTLAGVAFTVDAVANLTGGQSDQVAQLLHVLRTEASRAIDDIRRIVYDIRPPTLDQLGLRGAIVRQAHLLRRPDLDVDVQVDSDDELPAAVEVAAFRIATEALTNAARHTCARTVTVVVTRTGGQLRITIVDDDPTSTERAWTPGVGLTSMRERAEEVGGQLVAGPTPAGGRIEAVLPLA